MTVSRLALMIILTIGLLAAPFPSHAQQPTKVYRIGVLGGPPPPSPLSDRDWGAFREGLRERGYIEGQNLVIEYRWTGGQLERAPALAAELVGLKVDLIVAAASPRVRAAMEATSTIPIVMVYVPDPVVSGLVASLARPGGNVTGLTFTVGPDLVGKHLQLLKEAVPKLSRVAVLLDPASPYYPANLRETQAAAQALGMTLLSYEVRAPEEFEGAFSAMTKARAKALLMLPHPFLFFHAQRIAELAAKSRLPAVYPYREVVEVGGLMAYAANAPSMMRRAATYVDRILKGTKPADLPVERPTKFELVINLKTAKALGLTIPQSLLLEADEVFK